LRRIRILLVGIPRMLSDIISDAVAREPDMEIVGAPPDDGRLVSAATQLGAEVVVARLSGLGLSPDVGMLFDAHPRIQVLGVADDGRSTFLYQMRPQRTLLGALSPQELAAAVRAACEARASQLRNSLAHGRF